MKLGMTSWREVQQTPVAYFAGDETVQPETYRQISNGGYSSITAYIAAGAKHADVELTAITEERWRRLTFASYYIDEYIDTADNLTQAHQYYNSGLAAALDNQNLQEFATTIPDTKNANPLLLPSVIILRNSIANSNTKQKEQLRRTALTISDAALAKAATGSIDEYIAILAAESDAMVDLYDYSAEGTVTSQPRYAQSSDTLHDIMRVAVFGDSTLDLREDYEHGLTRVKPTPHAIGKLALQAVTPALRAARQPMTWHMLRQVKPRIVQ